MEKIMFYYGTFKFISFFISHQTNTSDAFLQKIKIFIILKFVYREVIEQALQLESYYLQTVHFFING